MCGIYGVMKYSNKEYNLIGLIEALGQNSIIRGSHATGISYIKNGQILVKKEPIKSTEFNFKDIYPRSDIYMGHVRLATTGKPELNFNNHPFLSANRSFALAHNGILYDTDEIKEYLKIDSNKIQTDTYLAVQILDKYSKVSLKSMKFLCENIIGEYLFTVMNKNGDMFFARKDNPICIYDFYKLGILVYASTEDILLKSIDGFMELSEAKTIGEFRRIKIKDGDILRIKKVKENKIVLHREKFDIFAEDDIYDLIFPPSKETVGSPCDSCLTGNCGDCTKYNDDYFLNPKNFSYKPLYHWY